MNDLATLVVTSNMTRALVQSGKLLDIEVLDHCVVTNDGYVSLKERGLGFGA